MMQISSLKATAGSGYNGKGNEGYQMYHEYQELLDFVRP